MDYEDSVWITAFSLNDTNSDRRQKASSPFVNPQSSVLRFWSNLMAVFEIARIFYRVVSEFEHFIVI